LRWCSRARARDLSRPPPALTANTHDRPRCATTTATTTTTTAHTAPTTAAAAARASLSTGAFSFFAGAGDAAVPVAPAGSSSVRVAAKAGGGGALEVTVSCASGPSARASYPPSALRRLADAPLELAETPRVSVLHAALLDALMRQAHARYAQLAAWPDFAAFLGRDDYYYRAHPADVRRLHELADGFHEAHEAVADAEGLAALATQLVPEARRRRASTLGPAVGPTVGNAAVARWLLSRAG
jgi:hypothetical protein